MIKDDKHRRWFRVVLLAGASLGASYTVWSLLAALLLAATLLLPLSFLTVLWLWAWEAAEEVKELPPQAAVRKRDGEALREQESYRAG